jgi:hypothetical protein
MAAMVSQFTKAAVNHHYSKPDCAATFYLRRIPMRERAAAARRHPHAGLLRRDGALVAVRSFPPAVSKTDTPPPSLSAARRNCSFARSAAGSSR